MFTKSKIKIFIFTLMLFSFFSFNLYAADVYNYNDLSTAVTNRETNINFAAPNINISSRISVDYAGAVDFYGPVALDGGGASGILSFSNSSAFHDNIRFINGNSLRGGAIYNEGTIELSASSAAFQNNIADTGGALYNAVDSSITFGDVLFTGNTATRTEDNIGGGAIANQTRGKVNFNGNAEFSDNHTTSSIANGGAIYNYDGIITFGAASVASFENNSTLNYGGAIQNVYYGEINALEGSIISFTGNKAANTGGAIYNTGTGIITSSGAVEFTANETRTTGSTRGGGAIYNQGRIYLADSLFSVNKSSSHGGAVYNAEGTITMGSAEFNGNTARGSGGAIYNSGTATISSAAFSGNAAGSSGGAIYNSGTLNLTSSNGGDIIFENNTAHLTANDIYNAASGIININGTSNSVSVQSGIAGLGTINKSGAGILLLSGNNADFTGIFNQTGGLTTVTGDYFTGISSITSGTLEFAAGTVFGAGTVGIWENGILDITSPGDITFSGNVTGNGVINKTSVSTGRLTLAGDNSGFAGAYNQSSGITTVNAEGRMFGGVNNIADSLLQVTGGSIYYNVNLGNNGVLEHYSTASGNTTLNAGSITFTGAGAKASFGKDAALNGNANYTLGGKIDNGSANIAEFNNSAVYFGIDDYAGGTTYTFNDSGIDITSGGSSTRTVTFDNFGASNTSLDFGLNFLGGAGLSADMLKSNNAASGSGLLLGAIKVLNDNDTGLSSSYGVEVLDGILFQNGQTKAIATNAYEYLASVNGAGTGIDLNVIRESDEYSLNAMNIHNGDRGFNFSFFTNTPSVYNIGASLNDTAAGTFTVQGYDSRVSNNIISGVLKGNASARGSFFNMVNATDLTVKDLTIENAYINGSGAVLRIANSASTAIFDNVILQNNESALYGGAIYNENGTTSIKNTLFDANQAANGGALANTVSGVVNIKNGVSFTGNTGDVNGGAIYNGSGEINFDTDLGETVIFSGNNAAAGRDIYNDGGIVNIAGAGDVIFGGGIEGTGTINKTGAGKAHFEAGSKTDFGGSFNLSGGNVRFSTSAKISNMEIGAAGVLTLDVDFIGELTKTLYFDNIKINAAGSKLYVNNISADTVEGRASRAVFYSVNANNGTFSDSSIYDVDTGSSNYKLVWQAGSYDGGYSYMGLLTLENLGPWNTFVAAYKAVTSENAIFLTQDITAVTNDDDAFALPGFSDFTMAGYGGNNYVINSNGLEGKGLFINDDQTVAIENLTFTDFFGGVISNYGFVNIGDEVSFINNHATNISGYGGAMYNYAGSIAAFTNADVLFQENGSSWGGAIANYGISGFEAPVINFINSSVAFNGNTSTYGGALYNSSGGEINFSIGSDNSVKFFNNSASNGGAIYNTSGSTAAFTGGSVMFASNTAISAGGGAIFNSADSFVKFVNADILFSSNSAHTGGAIYTRSNSTIDFMSSLVSFIDNSANMGGAVYADSGANTNFSGGEVNFEGNEAQTLGGALYIKGSAVSFNTDGGEVAFTENTASGKPNDAWMDTNAVLNISGSNAIRFEGGILTAASGAGIEINKSGSGAMYLGGDNEIWGDFNITGGDIIMLADATYKGKALELGTASGLDIHNDSVNTVDVTGNFKSVKDLKLDVFSDGSGDKITAGTADIGGNIDIFAGVGTYNNVTYDLIITSGSGNVSGMFISSSLVSSSNLIYSLIKDADSKIVKLVVNGLSVSDFMALSPLTYNQRETAKTFDKMSQNPGAWGTVLTEMRDKQNGATEAEIAEVKDFLSQTSGYFLANVIRNMAADSPNNEVYDKIRNHKEEHKTNSGLWVQLKGGIESFKEDENSLDDYRDASMGVMFGFDRFIADKLGGNLMWGVYGRINKDYAEQGKHKADGNKNGLGVYGGYIKDSWELKGMLLGSYDKFSTERAVMGNTAKADISGMTVSADLEAALKVGLTKAIDLRPYAGIEAANSMYGGFKEKGAGIYNLDTESGDYLRSAARIGTGLDYEKGRWIWYANVEGKYVIEGTRNEIKSEFENTGMEFYSRGTEEGNIEIGTGLGGEVRITENWKAFANAKYYAGERYENLYGNIGVRYMFGKNDKKEDQEKQKLEEQMKEEAAMREAEKAAEEKLKAEQAAAQAKAKAKEEAERIKQEEAERQRQEALIKKEISDEELAKQKAEAEERRKRQMIKTYTLTANFKTGSYFLTDEFKEQIRGIAKELEQYDYKKITIEGHTDSTGSKEINKRLSRQRARSVYDEFIKAGVPSEKINYAGFADSMPVKSNATAEGMAANRRTEIFIE